MTKRSIFKPCLVAVLILAMLLTSCFSFVIANATTNNHEVYNFIEKAYRKAPSAQELSQINHDLDLLSSCSISKDNITAVTKEGDFFVYDTTRPGDTTRSSISVKTLTNQNVQYTFKEGSLQNELVVSNKGEITLDGNKVTITEESAPSIQPQLLKASKVWKSTYKDFKPYKKLKRSSYSKFLTEGKVNVALGETIDKIASHVLLTLFAKTKLWAQITCNAIPYVSEVLNYLKSKKPKTTAVGIAYKTYTHGSNDYKYICKHYPNKKCTGSSYKTETIFEHFVTY